MKLKLTVVGNQSMVLTKTERNPDQTLKVEKEKVARISAQGDKSTLQFTTDYESGKSFALDTEITITIE